MPHPDGDRLARASGLVPDGVRKESLVRQYRIELR